MILFNDWDNIKKVLPPLWIMLNRAYNWEMWNYLRFINKLQKFTLNSMTLTIKLWRYRKVMSRRNPTEFLQRVRSIFKKRWRSSNSKCSSKSSGKYWRQSSRIGSPSHKRGLGNELKFLIFLILTYRNWKVYVKK